jgi:hypothetical protein
MMDRGIPTEAVLQQMRQSDPPVSYLVGTPKGRLSRYEKALTEKPWHKVREGVEVKLLPQDNSNLATPVSDSSSSTQVQLTEDDSFNNLKL